MASKFGKWLKKATTPPKPARQAWNRYVKPIGGMIEEQTGVSGAWNQYVKPIGTGSRDFWNKAVKPWGKLKIGDVTAAMGSELVRGMDKDRANWLFGDESWWSALGSAYNPTTGRMAPSYKPEWSDPTRPDYVGTQLFPTDMYEGGRGLKQYGGYDPRAFLDPQSAMEAVFGGKNLSQEQIDELMAGLEAMIGTIDKSTLAMGTEAAQPYKEGRANILRDLLGTGSYTQAQRGGGSGYGTATPTTGTEALTEEMQRFTQPYESRVAGSVESAQEDIIDIISYLKSQADEYGIDVNEPTFG